MKLLLFDIDGTILHTHGLGRRLVDEVFLELTGRHSPVRITYSGKTDPQIAYEMTDAIGIVGPERDEIAVRALALYTERILEQLPNERVTMLQGVQALIERLATIDSVQLALLTGNVESAAYAKLDAVGLSSFFDFGAFGSDSANRYELPAIAQRRAKEMTGRLFEGDNIVIIGDTEHDIRCGASIGAFSVGVCTGRYGRDELSVHLPNALFDDLADIEHFERVVLHRVA